ncbi:hypothetical protein [Roseobacter sp. HKCCA0434]|uniref:hypothetical protein n=1 Tax=Roseobacter sp. HKCCA0434 TaxID=3079297 RepID=UPI002905DC6C|nr:hypothetical protein [Roseobacter sp. HKCCA0434]
MPIFRVQAIPLLLLAACTAPDDEARFDTGPILTSRGAPYGADNTLSVVAHSRSGEVVGEECRATIAGERTIFALPGILAGPGTITDLSCTYNGTTLFHDGPVDPGTSQVRFVFN